MKKTQTLPAAAASLSPLISPEGRTLISLPLPIPSNTIPPSVSA